jgi:hypothetical protein
LNHFLSKLPQPNRRERCGFMSCRKDSVWIVRSPIHIWKVASPSRAVSEQLATQTRAATRTRPYSEFVQSPRLRSSDPNLQSWSVKDPFLGAMR